MGKHKRNDPCWCGSDKKYKDCHLNRDKMKKPELWEVNNELKNSFDKKYCSCPEQIKHECNGKIINSHTVSKGASLSSIAEKNHVYGLKVDLFKIDEGNGFIEPELIGVNKASTFTGFCAYHDKTLFSPFENSIFSYTKEQIFLLSYRTLSREHFLKVAHYESQKILEMGDAGLGLLEQIDFQKFVAAHKKSMELGIRDSLYHKNIYDEILLEKAYDKMLSIVIKFDKFLPFQFSGTHYPVVNFDGKKIQSLADKNTLDLICMATINDDKCSYLVISWLNEKHGSCTNFSESIISKSYAFTSQEIVNYIYSHFENVYSQPSWWNSLPQKEKTFILNSTQPLHEYNPIKEGEFNFHNCTIESIVSNR